MALLLCGGCSRHIQKSHGTCPFCGATEGHVPGSRPLSRATRALLLFSAAAVSAAAPAACSPDDRVVEDVATDAAYGAPGLEWDASGWDASDSGEADAPNVSVDAAYGGPAFDAGGDAEADAEADGD